MAAPYIMPDGPGGRPYRLTERPEGKAGKGKGSGARGKDAAWSALQAKMGGAASLEDLAELRAIERAGWRRRNRWFNDKALRDGFNARFGRLTAEEMQNQFNPPPFGGPQRPSIFSEVSGPEHAPLWEHFRSISMDREEKVLGRWEDHNRGLAAGGGAGGGASAAPPAPPGGSPAAAIRAWARVGRPARAALKKANPHTVMELEHEVMGLLEAGDPSSELLMDVPDGFGRLLVHGLCEFHGLLSATRNVGGRALVAVYFRRQQPQQQAAREDAAAGPQEQQQTADAAATPPATGSAGWRGDAHGGGDAPDITCTDVLLALREAAPQGGFDAAVLGRFVRSMHVGSDALSDDFVMV
ncbi:MAG: hypothetical protein J3K34DRAFT_45498 [Monoraphidium minutum]|nr:MAG: hypothetical protein J3K34DRAFT_45498 [Monoraphidium minutum]